jgi:hypothetical protein
MSFHLDIPKLEITKIYKYILEMFLWFEMFNSLYECFMSTNKHTPKLKFQKSSCVQNQEI